MASDLNNDLQELGDLVDLELDRCQVADLPNVCAMNATPEGRAKNREQILRYCLTGEGMSPASAMLALEKEYSFTTLD